MEKIPKSNKKHILDPHQVLKEYWGYDSFRPLQLDIIQSSLDAYDTLALLPTGGGKSLCFQVPALCLGGLCLVVSPLIALMKDQVEQLKKRGIAAEALVSGMKYQDLDRLLDLAVHGYLNFLYVSPERLQTELFLARLERMPLQLIAVDEAHCISQWGHDFRPNYLKIAEIRKIHTKVPIIALTATATAKVVEEIQSFLGFKKKQTKVFQKSFARPNLSYLVFHEQNKQEKLYQILKKTKGSSVVYAATRREVKNLSQWLNTRGLSADFYHGGLNSEQRTKVQEAWIQNRKRIIVATNAFGMGIDKPDVETVVHIQMPESLEAYFQEAGRAGRDGQEAYAVLLHSPRDAQILEDNLAKSVFDKDNVYRVYNALGNYFQLAIGSGKDQTFDFELSDFCQKFNLNPLTVTQVLGLLSQENYLFLNEDVFHAPTAQILLPKEQLYEFQVLQPRFDRLIEAILRSSQGIHSQAVVLQEQKIAQILGITLLELRRKLKLLHQEEVICYEPAGQFPRITFLTERLDRNNLNINWKRYNDLQKYRKQRVQAAIEYLEMQDRCRVQYLLQYFNEAQAQTCGKCDYCRSQGRNLKQQNQEKERINAFLIKQLSQQALNLEQILSAFSTLKQEQVKELIEELSASEVLGRDKFYRFYCYNSPADPEKKDQA